MEYVYSLSKYSGWKKNLKTVFDETGYMLFEGLKCFRGVLKIPSSKETIDNLFVENIEEYCLSKSDIRNHLSNTELSKKNLENKLESIYLQSVVNNVQITRQDLINSLEYGFNRKDSKIFHDTLAKLKVYIATLQTRLPEVSVPIEERYLELQKREGLHNSFKINPRTGECTLTVTAGATDWQISKLITFAETMMQVELEPFTYTGRICGRDYMNSGFKCKLRSTGRRSIYFGSKDEDV